MSGSSPRATYDEGLAVGELRYQWCRDCSAPVFYPRVMCPTCAGTGLEWRRSRGSGTVYSVTVVEARENEDYNVCLVDLDEGFRMMSTVLGPAAEPEIGDRVEVRFTKLSGQHAPVFAKAGSR